MKWKIGLFCFLLFGLVFSTVPTWVQPGLSLTYECYSTFISQGQYTDAVGAKVTINVNSVTPNSVSGITYVEDVLFLGYVTQYPFTCYEGQPCDWLFWVDPNNPTQTTVGPNGEKYTDGGSAGPFSYEGVYVSGSYSVEDAIMLFYQNEETGVEYHLLYETQTGLIVAYTEIFPSQETYLYLIGLNADLGGYGEIQQNYDEQIDQGQQNEDQDDYDVQNGETQQGDEEQQNGDYQQDENNYADDESDGGTICLSMIIMLIPFLGIEIRKE